MDLGLSDRVYVVTGASRGLGRACARQLVAEGARVVLSSRGADALGALVDELGGSDQAIAVPGDLAEPGLEGRLTAAAVARFGRLDGALISVGGPPPAAVMEAEDDVWRASFESIFLGPLRLARTIGQLASPEGASVVFVLSTTVREPIAGLGVSNGLRPGLAMAAKSLASELGPRAVRVNGVMPGRIETDRVRDLDAAGDHPEAARARAERAIPLGRYGEPAEFARVAVFLLSPAASYVTGTALAVDGGATRGL